MQANNSKQANLISRRDKGRMQWIALQPIEEAQKLLFAYTEEPPFSPGRKYDRATVELWARSEPPCIGNQILELYHRQFDDCELDLVGFVRVAISSGDAETAKQIQQILKEVCGRGHADRRKVWDALSQSEQSAFKALLAINSEADSTASHIAPQKIKVGDRVKITPKYPKVCTQTLIGVQGTVREDKGEKWGFDIEFDVEVEIVDGKLKKSLVISPEFLALIPADRGSSQ